MTNVIARFRVFLVVAALLGLQLGALSPARAATVNPAPAPTVIPSNHNDVSAPLRSLTPPPRDGARVERPHKAVPGARVGTHGSTPGQQANAPAPPPSGNFEGIGQGFTGPGGTFSVSSAPPDTNGATGPNHYAEVVNTDLAVFNKTGTPIFGPVPINTVWSGFGGPCQTDNDGDATVLYDQMADRWVVTQFAIRGANLMCVGVSVSGDPTGSYNRYSFPYSQLPDYPKLSVWPDGYYLTVNLFQNGSTFAGAGVAALDRTRMLAGLPATQQLFQTPANIGSLLPSTLDGSRLPPAGAPNHLLSLGNDSASLFSWNFHVDWTTPGNSTFTGPLTIPVAPYSAACGGGTCIPQAGTTQQLDSLADRLMYRLAYRNFGDHESIVANHSVTVGSSVGVRWYELRMAGGNPTLFQQGTYAPDADFRWMGSIAMDSAGDMALGFSKSSATTNPSIDYAGRLVGDPAGQMPQTEVTVISGGGSQTANLSRWGDYTSMAVDPADDCTFWYANEYIPSNGTFNWRTRIASFKFPSCGTPPADDFSISANPASLALQQGNSGTSTISTAVTSGNPQSVALSAGGLPSGATASFNRTTINSGGSSTLTLTTASTTPAGVYPIVITGTGASATRSTTVSLTVTGATPIVNGGFETGDFTGWTRAGTTSISNTAHTGVHSAMVGGSSPTVGDSSIAQTFTAPAAGGSLSFFYDVRCPDLINYDWATATLLDNTAGTTTTVLPRVCTNSTSWVQVSSALAGSHSYTLTLITHDDNYPGDATYTLYDDVTYSPPPGGDFSISANPNSLTIQAGSAGTSTIATVLTSGTAQSINLSASGLPSGATAGFNPSPINSGQSSTLTLSTTFGTPPGTYPVTVTGTGSSATHSTTVTLTVTAPPPPDFSISANPSSVSAQQGGSATSTITTSVTSGAAQSITLSASGLPTAATASFNPLTITAGSSSTLTLSAGATTPVGSYTITVTGTGTGATHSTTVTFNVTAPPPPDFSISANPSNVSSQQGGSATSTISTAIISGAAQSITLSSGGLPTDATASFNPVTITAGSSSTLTLSAAATTPVGSYTIIVTGTGTSATHSTTVTFNVTAPPPPDFSISALPSSLSLVQGTSGTSTISTAVTSGAAQTITLSAGGLPTAATASFNPTSITAGGSSTLTLTVAATTPAGSYPVTVTGTGASATHSTTLTLTVTIPNSNPIVNGDFETGDFTGWSRTGTTSIANTAHAGAHSAMLGAVTATNGDSSISQTFVAPSAGGVLSFFYNIHCPDSINFDWATATLLDNTSATTVTMLPRVCTNSGAWTNISSNLTASHSYRLTLASHDDNYSGDPTYTLYDDVVVGAPPPPPLPGITNGGFESGDFSGWTTTGTASIATVAHSGSFSGMAGATGATNGDSTIAQTFNATTGATQVSLWYSSTCHDTVTYDWVKVTLRDNTAGATATLVPNTCAPSSAWTRVSAAVLAGHSYTLTLVNHDDNFASDPTFTRFDDVTLS